jgi:hypothetical protein
MSQRSASSFESWKPAPGQAPAHRCLRQGQLMSQVLICLHEIFDRGDVVTVMLINDDRRDFVIPEFGELRRRCIKIACLCLFEHNRASAICHYQAPTAPLATAAFENVASMPMAAKIGYPLALDVICSLYVLFVRGVNERLC